MAMCQCVQLRPKTLTNWHATESVGTTSLEHELLRALDRYHV
jgi:hypothetical protein